MGRTDYDVAMAYRNAPKEMGLELTERNGQWQGGYYLSGEPHPYRRDKLKVFIGRDGVWVAEEGGESVSLIDWLIKYGGAGDYRGALRIINGQDKAVHWDVESERRRAEETRYVPAEAVSGALAWGLERCPLFLWMSGLFGEPAVREAWSRYNVTSDGRGNCVFWYTDSRKRVLYDKRIAYRKDGHRNKDFFPGRTYLTRDGYNGRCLFGDNWVDWGRTVYVVESEKTALMVWMRYGRQCVATGGKNGLGAMRESMVLLPDYDARDEWAAKGRVWPWWKRWGIDEIPPKSDIGDMIEWRIRNGR